MICSKGEHFSIHRILFLWIGLWPYQRSRLSRFQIIFNFVILISSVIFQITTLLTAELSFNRIAKTISYTIFNLIYLIQYFMYWINIRTIKGCLDQLQHIFNELKDENEVAIIKKCGYNIKHYTIKLILLVWSFVFILILHPFLPRILGVFLFTNKSHSHPKLLIDTEYFIDQEKYFYLILLHMAVATSIGAAIILATGTITVGFLKYACGMFQVASYRIEQAIEIAMLVNVKLEDEIAIYKNMVYAVEIHRQATQFIDYLMRGLELALAILIVISVSALTFILYQLSQLLLCWNHIEEVACYFIFAGSIIIYMFLSNYAGQEVIDCHNYIFFTAYNVRWYKTPLYVQKFLLFLLVKGNKPFYLKIGKLFTASLEGFAALVNVSMSYFTVIYSTQQ